VNYRIEKPSAADIVELTKVAITTFRQSHGHSSPEEDLENYISQNFTEANFLAEIQNPLNDYHLLIVENKIVGYSKIRLNHSIEGYDQNITKLERIYLLEEVHGSGLGKVFFDFNVSISKDAGQKGIWLYVWVDNHRAIKFYNKMGFEIVGSYDFAISKTHSNPNHQMYLSFN
jgi:diamine N-acetyltransferase